MTQGIPVPGGSRVPLMSREMPVPSGGGVVPRETRGLWLMALN